MLCCEEVEQVVYLSLHFYLYRAFSVTATPPCACICVCVFVPHLINLMLWWQGGEGWGCCRRWSSYVARPPDQDNDDHGNDDDEDNGDDKENGDDEHSEDEDNDDDDNDDDKDNGDDAHDCPPGSSCSTKRKNKVGNELLSKTRWEQNVWRRPSANPLSNLNPCSGAEGKDGGQSSCKRLSQTFLTLTSKNM